MPSVFRQTQNMQAEGAILPVSVGVPEIVRRVLSQKSQAIPGPIEVHALIDTGASCTCISPDVCQKLNLKPHGTAKMLTAGDPIYAHVYNIYMHMGNFGAIDPITVFAPPLVGPGNVQCLIGRDILAMCAFTYLGYVNTFSLSI